MIALVVTLALGFSFPQAFAHVTNNVAHNVQHIIEILSGVRSDVDQIGNMLNAGNYAQAVVLTRHTQVFILGGDEDGNAIVNAIPAAYKGTLHRIDCLLLGTNPDGLQTDNTFVLQSGGVETTVICDSEVEIELDPGDVLIYNCRLIDGAVAHNTECDAELTIWMTLKSS
ncbi:MAG TPA: hypothetical protein VJM08_09240 [Anaerolineales bacterium]|nr:hypothetical protein [Anaerolineales bacterium]